MVSSTKRKGILLAGGSGSRLHPTTKVISKQLIPVFDKPMVYYPLSTLMLAGVRDILLISTPNDTPLFSRLLGNGEQWGINIQYMVQNKPEGLAQAYILGQKFLDSQASVMVLGDNIFYGTGLARLLATANSNYDGATIFAYQVTDPERYGVVKFDKNKKAISIEEKPKKPESRFAVTGLYFYDNQVCDIASDLEPSARGELEITDINNYYLKTNNLSVERMGRGFAWLDTGTHESLLEASNYVSAIQKRQGLMVACPEEIAYQSGWISREQLLSASYLMKGTNYGRYLNELAI